ncbi:MAG TPA: hypothetical protein VFV37_05170 [Luteibaculaceae bacterium]|nr:hypothetical protein [Luteibaculaceae bacterium]
MKAIALGITFLLLTPFLAMSQQNKYDINYSAAYISKKAPASSARLMEASVNGKRVDCSIDVDGLDKELVFFIFPGPGVYIGDEEFPTRFILRRKDGNAVWEGVLTRMGKTLATAKVRDLASGEYFLQIEGLQTAEKLAVYWP